MKRSKDLPTVHIGTDQWRFGNLTMLKLPNGKDTNHVVIYGPNKKQYDVLGNDVAKLMDTDCNRKNRLYSGNVKIYILTHILDDGKNWVFNFDNPPTDGLVKVIYSNGTVKNVQAETCGEPIVVTKRYKITRTERICMFPKWGEGTHKLVNKDATLQHIVTPVAWRIQ